MKKQIFSVLFFFAFTITFVSAYSYSNMYGGTQDLINNLIYTGAPLIEAVLGPVNSIANFTSGEVLFIKFLIFFLLFVVIQAILKKVPLFEDNKAVIAILSIAIPIIGIRFMSANELIYGLLLPYGTLGVALMTILPFLIFFFFVHKTSLHSSGRRLCWIFFLLVYILLGFMRGNDLGDLGSQIYIITTLTILGTTIFDGKIHSYFGLATTKAFLSNVDEKNLADIKIEYVKYARALNADPTDKGLQNIVKNLKKRILQLGGSIPNVP